MHVNTLGSYVVNLLSLPADFLQTRPTEAHLRSEVCPKVGRKWREVCTYLNIQNTVVDMLVESNKHDIGEAFYRILCSWRDSERATWEVLLSALRKADLNAQANQLLHQGESGAVSCTMTAWRHASGICCSESELLLKHDSKGTCIQEYICRPEWW